VLSGVVSLTLIPMLCARMLHMTHEEKKQDIVLRVFEAMFQGWLKAYEWTLDRVTRFKAVTLAITLLTIAGTAWVYIAIPKGFFPSEDTDFIWQDSEAAPDTSFDSMAARQRQISAIVRADPAVEYANVFMGDGEYNTAFMSLKLKPRKQRDAADVV